MSTESGGGWLCAVSVLLACYTALPETLVYHQTRLLKRPIEPSRGLIEAEVTRAAKAFDLPPRLLHALVHVESGYKRQAESQVGARGLSQVMPTNAKRCGLEREQLWDAVANLRCGALILRQELDRVGDVSKALTVYNCGKVNCKEGKQYAQKVIALSTLIR
jgi:soluble lytic murein transglycosylase-like protein